MESNMFLGKSANPAIPQRDPPKTMILDPNVLNLKNRSIMGIK
jgi:hypothetical protein